MKKIDFLVILIPLVLFNSCAIEDELNTDKTETETETETEIPDSLIYNDVVGDVYFDYLDISEIKLETDDEYLYLEMLLENIPDSFVYSHETLDENYLEYNWEFNFDTDQDGTSANDFSISIMYFKPPSSDEQEGDILSFTQKDIWLTNEDATSVSVVDSSGLNTSISGNYIKFRVERAALNGVTILTPFKVKAFHNFEGATYIDMYPDDGSYQ